MKRLYSSKENPFYDKAVDKYMMDSDILNGGGMNFGLHSIIFTRDNMEGLLLEIVGNKDGDFRRDNDYEIAAIPFIKNKIRELEKKFTIYQDQQVKQGYKEPTEMPQRMLDEFYELQARLTVRQAEAEELRKRLQVYKDQEQKEDDSKVLEYGLRGVAHFHGPENPAMINVLKEIDGQIITQTEEGLLIINDPRSPYSGLSVFEYYALCKVYYSQQKQKERDKLKQVQEQCRLEGKTVPNHLGVQAPHKVSRSSLPKFPAGVKNWLKESPPLQQRVRKK